MDNKNTHYTEKEKILLATLIKEHPLIENKKTDGVTVQQKQLEWENLTTEFNRQPEVLTGRDSKQLKTLWKNLKQRKRKQTTFERHQALITGGGIAEKGVQDPLLDLVADAAEFMDVTVTNKFDSTAALISEQNENRDAESSNGLNFGNEDFDLNLTVNPTTPTPTSTRRNNKRKEPSEENNLRVKRIANQITADDELNILRVRIAEEDLKRAQYQSELARLELKKFKKDNNNTL